MDSIVSYADKVRASRNVERFDPMLEEARCLHVDDAEMPQADTELTLTKVLADQDASKGKVNDRIP